MYARSQVRRTPPGRFLRSTQAIRMNRRHSKSVWIPWHSRIDSRQETTRLLQRLHRYEFNPVSVLNRLDFLTWFQPQSVTNSPGYDDLVLRGYSYGIHTQCLSIHISYYDQVCPCWYLWGKLRDGYCHPALEGDPDVQLSVLSRLRDGYRGHHDFRSANASGGPGIRIIACLFSKQVLRKKPSPDSVPLVKRQCAPVASDEFSAAASRRRSYQRVIPAAAGNPLVS